jgi:hypothetical protein
MAGEVDFRQVRSATTAESATSSTESPICEKRRSRPDARQSLGRGVPLGALSAKAANGGRRRPSRHELADNLAADVSKPEVAALEAVGQLGVVESEQV